MTLDLVLRGGFVVDGSGAPAFRADVGIAGGRVVALGAVDDPARRVIGIEGQFVAPGFVDVHTHYDAQALWDPTLSPSPLHGVTSVVAGNCGFSIAPLSAESADYLQRMLARVEGMPLSALQQGPDWDWKTTGEYFERIDGTMLINAGFLVGHSTIRRVAMGPDALERPATTEEVVDMCRLLREALEVGALGFSSSWSPSHLDDNSHPVPSLASTDGELLALANELKAFPGTSLEFIANFPSSPFTERQLELVTAMSVAAGRPLNWNVLSTNTPVDFAEEKLGAGDYARTHGAKVVGLVNPKPIATRMNFLSAFMIDCIPGWQEAMALPPGERLALLRDPRRRAELEKAAASPEAQDFAAFSTQWPSYLIYETTSPELKRYEGQIVADIAAAEGKAPFDALLDIVCADELRTSYGMVDTPTTRAALQDRVRVWRNRNAVLGASDAGAHLDMLGAFDYTTYLLGVSVREQELLSLEEAVKLLTSVPADLYGLHDRGRVLEGAMADLVVFDPATVGTNPLSTRFDCPGGGGRLYAEATGVSHVLVSGEEVVRHGDFTEARPGAVLRAGRDTETPSLI